MGCNFRQSSNPDNNGRTLLVFGHCILSSPRGDSTRTTLFIAFLLNDRLQYLYFYSTVSVLPRRSLANLICRTREE